MQRPVTHVEKKKQKKRKKKKKKKLIAEITASMPPVVLNGEIKAFVKMVCLSLIFSDEYSA